MTLTLEPNSVGDAPRLADAAHPLAVKRQLLMVFSELGGNLATPLTQMDD